MRSDGLCYLMVLLMLGAFTPLSSKSAESRMSSLSLQSF